MTQDATELPSDAMPQSRTPRAYVGTYTRFEHAEGIYVLEQDPATGELISLQTVAEVDPSFLAISNRGDVLFAVSEGIGRSAGAVASFRIDDESGTLTLISRQPTEGGMPCHLCVAPNDDWVVVANYEHGSVTLLPLDTEGALGAPTHVVEHAGSGPHPSHQTGPHAHFVTFDPAGEHILAVDKGIDKILTYQIDAEAKQLVPAASASVSVHSGAGPRHLTFAHSGKHVFVNNELDMTVSTLSYDGQSGALEELEWLPAVEEPPTDTHYWTGELLVESSGRYLYVSSRGDDTVTVFEIDERTGLLTVADRVPSGGETPRHLTLDPSGSRLYVTNQDSDSITFFDVEEGGRRLRRTELSPTTVPAPTCILFG